MVVNIGNKLNENKGDNNAISRGDIVTLLLYLLIQISVQITDIIHLLQMQLMLVTSC